MQVGGEAVSRKCESCAYRLCCSHIPEAVEESGELCAGGCGDCIVEPDEDGSGSYAEGRSHLEA